jgi:hypothetical protein
MNAPDVADEKEKCIRFTLLLGGAYEGISMKTKWRVMSTFTILASVCFLRDARAEILVRSGQGENAAKLRPTVNLFRSDVGGGGDVGADGSFQGMRREITWDGVGAFSAPPSSLPGDFFNTTSPRGVVLSSPGTGFQVSSKISDNTGLPANFGHINSAYTSTFLPFSGERLFTALDSNVVDVDFFVPGTTTPAYVKGFGAVFSDIEVTGSTIIEYFDPTGASLGAFVVPAGVPDLGQTTPTFSFLGVSSAELRIARVRITAGAAALGATVTDEAPNRDLVTMDDFIYAEPEAIDGGAPIDVLAPNGAEVVALNDSFAVRWTPANAAGTVKIELSRNNGGTWEVLTDSTPDDGDEAVTILGPSTAEALIRVTSNANAAATDKSNAVFTIGTPQAPQTPTPGPTPTKTPGVTSTADVVVNFNKVFLVETRGREQVVGGMVVSNQGSQPTGSFSIDVFGTTRATVGSGAVLLLRTTIPTLPVGDSKTISFRSSVSQDIRKLNVIVEADTKGDVRETDENNNSARTQVLRNRRRQPRK